MGRLAAWRIPATALSVAIVLCVRIGCGRRIHPAMQVTPAPEIERETDVEGSPFEIASYLEVSDWLNLAGRGKLTVEQRQRVMVLGTKAGYPLTRVQAWGILKAGLNEDERKQLVPALLKSLDHPSAFLRTSAIRTLGALKVSEAAPRVVAFLQSPNRDERRAARQALPRMGLTPPPGPADAD